MAQSLVKIANSLVACAPRDCVEAQSSLEVGGDLLKQCTLGFRSNESGNYLTVLEEQQCWDTHDRELGRRRDVDVDVEFSY